MHYHAEVWLPTNENVEEQLEQIMAPYCEHESDDGWWDWYQIGGRWTGTHDGYNPSKDERNIKTCWLCNGTGKRSDMEVANGCNRCNGKGKAVEWPTQWAEHEGDIFPVAEVSDDLDCYTLIVKGAVLHEQVWNRDAQKFDKTAFVGKVKQELAKRGITDGYLVTVDYHD